MTTSQELAVQQKKEVAPKQETTVPTRYFVPNTDIYETDDALTVVMEVPGVEKQHIDITLEDDVLKVEGKIDHLKYEGMEPVYSEYNVGHFARSFSLSDKIDQAGIAADLQDGVLMVTLKKSKDAQR